MTTTTSSKLLPLTASSPNPQTPTQQLIVQVWSYNVVSELKKISNLIQDFPYIAMDTEFPGVVAKPLECSNDLYYQSIQLNVNLLNIIQLGITLSDENGNHPSEASTWQFHFKFDLEQDVYATDSIRLLEESGVDFDNNKKYGILRELFAEYFITSGLVLNEDIHWICFHGLYDFAYLLKVSTNEQLTFSHDEFEQQLNTWFPNYYDIKQIMSEAALKGGLNKLGQYLQVERIGEQHQAGSDSLLTSDVFFKLRQNLKIDSEQKLNSFKNKLYGLDSAFEFENYIEGSDYWFGDVIKNAPFKCRYEFSQLQYTKKYLQTPSPYSMLSGIQQKLISDLETYHGQRDPKNQSNSPGWYEGRNPQQQYSQCYIYRNDYNIPLNNNPNAWKGNYHESQLNSNIVNKMFPIQSAYQQHYQQLHYVEALSN